MTMTIKLTNFKSRICCSGFDARQEPMLAYVICNSDNDNGNDSSKDVRIIMTIATHCTLLLLL